MSSPKEVPCPHCRASITLSFRDFFPTRQTRIDCPECEGSSTLPWKAVLWGLFALLVVMAILALVLKAALGPVTLDFETMPWPEKIAAGAVLLLLAWTGSLAGTKICRDLTERLDPAPRGRG